MRGIASFVLVLLLAGTTGAATAPAQRCQSAKNKEAGKYAACRLNAEAKFAATGDGAARATALQKCLAQYAATWPGLETKAVAAGGACPSVSDQAAIQGFIDANTSALAAALAGGTLVSCPGLAECQADVTRCEAVPRGQTIKTGFTTCYAGFPLQAGSPPPVPPGTVIPCAGTGQDGEFQAGLAPAYVDNGDGTITDTNTGLMWEKLSGDGSVHDRSAPYNQVIPIGFRTDHLWVRIEEKMAALNGGSGFAGYRDWRVPNLNELESIDLPQIVAPAFNTGCVVGCTVLTCSCPGGASWSSTSTPFGWIPGGPFGGFSGSIPPEFGLRAVRGGSVPTTTTTPTSSTTTTTTTTLPPVCCGFTGGGGCTIVSAAECGSIGSVQSGVCRNDGTCGVPTAPGDCCDTAAIPSFASSGLNCYVLASNTKGSCDSGTGAVFSPSAVCTATGCQ
jgi:hypothetical protein